jgi:hypothetical protein
VIEKISLIRDPNGNVHGPERISALERLSAVGGCGVIVLHIKAQNAGLMLTRMENNIKSRRSSFHRRTRLYTRKRVI